MKEHVDRLFGKLRSSKGETLAELLVSVLVIVLGLTMFATAMMSSKKMLVKGDAVMQAYYTQRNILEGEETKNERNGRLILETRAQESTGSICILTRKVQKQDSISAIAGKIKK